MAGGCYFLGGFGRLYSDRVDVAAQGYDAIVPTMLEGLSTVLIAVVVVLVLSASMSTLSSLVLASSSTLTLDFIKDNLIRDMDEKRQVRWMRALVVVFIAISVVLTGTWLTMVFEPQLRLVDALFEITSAFGTVGLSTGITTTLGVPAKLVSILIMYIGRLGPLTIASVWYFDKGERVSYPEGNIAIG